MEWHEKPRLDHGELIQLFTRMFPNGPSGEDVLREIAPDGWEKSELVRVAHPSPEKLLDEATRMHHNISTLLKHRDTEPPDPAPTLNEIVASYKPSPIDIPRECAEIVGKALWDLFSDNHDVIAPDGRLADIGSFRGAGGFIADWLDGLVTGVSYDYMDFYMGTIWVNDRADFSPVYRMIFGRLHALGYDWQYAFPRLGVVRFGSGEATQPIAGYDPSAAFELEQREQERQKEFEQMQEDLRKSYNEAVVGSRSLPPPETVKAYMNVFGLAPVGWPPVQDKGSYCGD